MTLTRLSQPKAGEAEYVKTTIKNAIGNISNCMQDTFARATHSAGQARRATIGYLVYNISN